MGEIESITTEEMINIMIENKERVADCKNFGKVNICKYTKTGNPSFCEKCRSYKSA